MEHTTNALAGVVKVVYLKADNATFAMKNGFLSLSITADREDFEKESYPRVFLHRDFPFELPWEYISVIDEDKKEIGIIRNVTDFADEQKQLIVTEHLYGGMTDAVERGANLLFFAGADTFRETVTRNSFKSPWWETGEIWYLNHTNNAQACGIVAEHPATSAIPSP